MSAASQSKSDRSYDLLKHRIPDGRYGPGYRIVLDQVAGEFGVDDIAHVRAINVRIADASPDFDPQVLSAQHKIRTVDAMAVQNAAIGKAHRL
jgi:hypothetical protein